MHFPKKTLSILTAFLLLATVFIEKPPTVKAETADYRITSSNIENNKTDVTRVLMLKLKVNFPFDNAHFDDSKVSLKDSEGNNVGLGWKYGVDCLELLPYGYLIPDTQYTLTVLKDAFNIGSSEPYRNLSENFTLTFKTRSDNTVKIGKDGDYSGFMDDFSSIFYNIDNANSDVRPKLDVLVERGTYKVPQIYLRAAAASVSIKGGYDFTFTAQDEKSPSVLTHADATMFDIEEYDNWSPGTSFDFEFNNLTFTTDGELHEVNYIPIKLQNYDPIHINVDVVKCNFVNLGAERGYSEVDEYASPISAVVLGDSTLNLNVDRSLFGNNEYFYGHSGGIFVYTKDYEYYNNLKAAAGSGESTDNGPSATVAVTNSIFADNLGRESGAIALKSDFPEGLKAQIMNNTIVNNEGYYQIMDLKEGQLIKSSGGVALISESDISTIEASLTNNIIYGNTAGESSNDILLYGEGSYNENYFALDCIMDANNYNQLIKSGTDTDGNFPIKLSNNRQLSVNPLFVGHNDFHLSNNSSMIDKGVPVKLSVDFDGNKRPQGKAFDIGAYETYAAVPQKSTFGFTAASQEVLEASGKAVVTVKRTDSTSGTASVSYSIHEGTAKFKEDFGEVTGILTFQEGETSKTFEVYIVDDAVFERDENFAATLSNPSEGSVLGEITTQTITIKNDDQKPKQLVGFAVSSMNIDETNSKATVTINRTVSTEGRITVNYNTQDGTAKAGEDYTAASGTLTFEDGEASKTFDIAIINDTAVEQAESFTAVLSNPSEGANLGEISSMTININSEDTVPVSTLPKTGGMLDFNLLIILGLALIVAGIVAGGRFVRHVLPTKSK